MFYIARVGVVSLTVLFTAGCGGGDYTPTEGQDNQAQVSVEGQVHSVTSQQYTVFYDENENGTLDSGEPSTLSDADGNYVLSMSPGNSSAVIVATPVATTAVVATRGLGSDVWDGFKTFIKNFQWNGSGSTQLRATSSSNVEAHISLLSTLALEQMYSLDDDNLTKNNSEALYKEAVEKVASYLNIASDELFANPELNTQTHKLNTELEALEVLLVEGFKNADANATPSRNSVRKAILSSLQNNGNSVLSDFETIVNDVDNAFETDITAPVKSFVTSQISTIETLLDSNDSIASKGSYVMDLLPKAAQRLLDYNASDANAKITPVQKQRVFMAFSGGGWNTHSASAGWMMGALAALKAEDKNGTMQELTKNVEAISCNSGGCWFTSHLAFSEYFLEGIQDTNVSTYASTGYLGQIRNIFTTNVQYAISKPSDLDLAGFVFGSPTDQLTDLEYINSVLGFTSWFNTMENTAYAPLGLYDTAMTATLGDDDRALLWAMDKSIIFSTALNTNAYIGGTEPTLKNTSGESDLDMVGDDIECSTLGIGCDDTVLEPQVFPVSYNATFVNNPGVPTQVNSSPVLLTKLAVTRNHVKPDVFLAGDVSLNYTDENGNNGSAASLIAHNISTDSLSVFDAACSSSSAGGAVATVNSTLGSYLNSMQDAAAGFYIDTDTSVFTRFSSYDGGHSQTSQFTTSVSDNTANINQIRMNDGGYIDNTSVAYMIKFLQTNNLDDNFKIVLFMNSSSTDLMQIDANISVVSDVARLFVGSNDEYLVDSNNSTTYLVAPNTVSDSVNNEVDNSDILKAISMLTLVADYEGDSAVSDLNNAVNELTTTMTSNVFDKASWNSAKLKWSAPSQNNYMASYVVFDVTTVENTSFGINAGSKGELHVFFSNKTDSSAAPGLTKVTADVLDAYVNLLNNNYNNVQSDALWPLVKGAFNLTE